MEFVDDLQKMMQMMDSESDSDAEIDEQFEMMLAMSKEAEKINKQPPSARPSKNRSVCISMQENKCEKSSSMFKMQFGFKQTWITGKTHCSVKEIDQLKPIRLNQMKVPMVHEGFYMVCRVVTSSTITAQQLALKTSMMKLKALDFIYNFHSDLNDPTWLKKGTIMIIKEPYLKFSPSMTAFIRVDSPSESDKKLEKLAPKWYVPEKHSFDMLKRKGNELFVARDYEGAVDFYERALAASDSAVVWLNMAAALLPLDRFEEAYESAKKAVENYRLGDAEKSKASFRLGKAAYGMRKWGKSIEHFEAALALCTPNDDDARCAESIRKELVRAKDRHAESTTGKYDIAMLIEKCIGSSHSQINFDLADYAGPLKVADIPGKGKGLVVTQSISKGTLLIASKAYAIAFPNRSSIILSTNLVTNEGKEGTQVQCIIDTVQKLKQNPSTASELYALWAGPKSRDEPIVPDGLIDTGRIERICSLNLYAGAVLGDQFFDETTAKLNAESYSATGLWILPSFMNHACAANTFRSFYGDMMFVYATSDLNEGDELTANYVSPMEFFVERKKRLQRWAFKCECKLCILDRSEPEAEKQRQELIARMEAIKPHVMANPANSLVPALSVARAMRQTYKNRRDFCVHLFRPLGMLGFVHQSRGEIDKAVEVTREAFRKSLTSPLCYIIGPDVNLRLAQLHSVLGNKASAKKAAKDAFELVRVRAGITNRSLFLKVYKNLLSKYEHTSDGLVNFASLLSG